jgi:hypothetical protein
LHSGAQHIAFDVLNRLGLCDIKLFAAQYPTPHDCCVRFATVVTGGPATLARGRLATALPPSDFHRLESASFAWRTEKILWGVARPAGNLGRYPNETCRRQIQPIYEGLDEADGILCTDIVVQALGQEECLAAVVAGDVRHARF